MVNKDEKTKTYCVICSFDNLKLKILRFSVFLFKSFTCVRSGSQVKGHNTHIQLDCKILWLSKSLEGFNEILDIFHLDGNYKRQQLTIYFLLGLASCSPATSKLVLTDEDAFCWYDLVKNNSCVVSNKTKVFFLHLSTHNSKLQTKTYSYLFKLQGFFIINISRINQSMS